MEPIRADEQTGSHIIHSDMFKELRDRAVVLADLSLDNPNVYYELGIRHVLSPGGTVLICREGADLPFDIRLSRVVFYRYNGIDLDWDVVEETIPKLKAALDKAKKREPDSPIHALLENVFPQSQGSARGSQSIAEWANDGEMAVDRYQKLVAEIWRERKENLPELLKSHSDTIFGARSLGKLCLGMDPIPAKSADVAQSLFGRGQYKMSCQLFEKLEKQGIEDSKYRLSPEHLFCFGSAKSELDPTLNGANDGIGLVEEAIRRAGDKAKPLLRFRLRNGLGGLFMWKLMLPREREDIDKAILHLTEAGDAASEMIALDKEFPTGVVAKLYLRLLLVLRRREQTKERMDTEGYRKKIMALDKKRATNGREASYLRWYKAIACADAGDEEATRDMIFDSVRQDALIGGQNAEPGVAVGSEQYRLLRRFIEDNLPFLNNHAILGQVSQALLR